MRPVQTFGRTTTFTGTTEPEGSSLKGHVYCPRLETTMVLEKIPIVPEQSSVRVLVVSPFTSDATALNRGEIASRKLDYIIELTKIRELFQFGCDVQNVVVRNVTFDEESFWKLPIEEPSPDVFLVEKHRLDPVVEDTGEIQTHQKKTMSTGGDSLLKSVDEETDATMILCTITINDKGPSSNVLNELQQIVNLLSTIDHQLEAGPARNMFVVRPGQEFVSDTMPQYLDTLFPDMFPFGQGGFDETRRVKISKKKSCIILRQPQ